ncbi:hypothetical protein [Allomuricauda sp. NBRC 101325]|nr:hypothetical protein [Muricauda sp. NBRC 101325]
MNGTTGSDLTNALFGLMDGVFGLTDVGHRLWVRGKGFGLRD